MTFHSTVYDTQLNREHSGGGSHPHQSRSIALLSLGWATVNVVSNPINDPLIPFSGYANPPIKSVDFRTITDNAATISLGRGYHQNRAVSLDGSSLDNNTNLLAKLVGDSGRVAPDVILSTGGAVQTALAALVGTTDDLDVYADHAYIDESYTGLAHFCEFESHPPDSASSGAQRLQELFSLISSSGASYQCGVDALGTPIVVEQCGFSAVDPSGTVYITPTDIGNGPDQIPAAVSDNTPDGFRAHPSVFFPSGRTRYVRGMTRQFNDATPLVTGSAGNPLKIIRVDAAPTSSNWLAIIDGTPVVLNVPHPAGSDHRRPRDIWHNVILPLINSGGANQQFSVYGSPPGTVGGALQTRLEYSEYWRCLPIPGTRITQTGTGG